MFSKCHNWFLTIQFSSLFLDWKSRISSVKASIWIKIQAFLFVDKTEIQLHFFFFIYVICKFLSPLVNNIRELLSKNLLRSLTYYVKAILWPSFVLQHEFYDVNADTDIAEYYKTFYKQLPISLTRRSNPLRALYSKRGYFSLY